MALQSFLAATFVTTILALTKARGAAGLVDVLCSKPIGVSSADPSPQLSSTNDEFLKITRSQSRQLRNGRMDYVGPMR